MNEYTFKPLTTDDIVPVCKIIRGIGVENIKKEIKQLDIKPVTALKSNTDKADEADKAEMKSKQIDFAVDIIAVILKIITSNMDKIHTELKKLLASKTDMTFKEISELPFDEYLNLIMAFCKQKEFTSFFTVVSKSTGLTM